MALIRDNVVGHGYGNVYVDSLVWGGRLWAPSVPIKVWLGDSSEYNAAVKNRGGDDGYFHADPTDPQAAHLNPGDIQDWILSDDPSLNEPAVASLVYALNLYSSVCGVQFDTSTTSIEEADIVWWKVDLSPFGDGVAGIHESLGSSETRTQVWGYFNPENRESWNSQSFGGDGLNTIIHEIGHGLGLAHPHGGGTQPDKTTFPGADDGSIGDLGLNQSVFTVMSYNPGLSIAKGDLTYGTQGGLGAFDIAALQALYGKNLTTATGDDVYELFSQSAVGTGWMCIWDAGGDDWIRGRNATGSVTIDLRAATLKNNDPNAGGYISHQVGVAGGFTIANGAVIENAEGGDFDDVLIGNEAANMLQGQKGSDVLAGFAGDDILDAGDGDDTLEGGEGADQFYGGNGSDLASYSQAAAGVTVNLADWSKNTGDAKGDTFSMIEGVLGSDFNDIITGTDAAEFIGGGGGADVLTGGGGDDVYVVEGHADQIVELAGGGNDTVITSANASLVTFANCESLFAAAGTAAINLYGNASSNKLVGNDGANLLDGGAGADDLQGGAGNDTYVVDTALDKVTDTTGTDTVVTSVSYTLSASVERLYATGSAAINLTGNTIVNIIKGNAAANKISGGAGNDVLYGGAGKDIFLFNTTPNSTSNKDVIGDWNKTYDTIQLENAVFRKLTKTGMLNSSFFKLAAKALDANDYVGYDKISGNLWYDPNGNAAGGQVAFANIGKYKLIAYNDFVVI